MDIVNKLNHTITFEYSNSSGNPDCIGQKISNLRLWMKLDNLEWFKPISNFHKSQIVDMITICRTEAQLLALLDGLKSDI